ncbi:hypothetical protein [Chitinophaga barathri]|uniref:DUF3887 domain-containing protein n=1 Tax=Chitinophaga barathri TaxID=1647451 RepID=A0A3N4MMU5_9BACT|nr:hypothetical protein [Chitinophaga barathri]RPD41370.1 hypothetical protein EG028_08600 [Chitinophaga barathri]
MIIDVNKQDLSALYDKAKEKYKECINNKENEFLQKEVGASLKSVMSKEKSIKIVFSPEFTGKYLVEICLALSDKDDSLLGEYMYVENEKGDIIDDSLVFW